MSYLHDEIDDDQPRLSRDREVTLSTPTILGIFFGLALLCAVFFGFGYNMGSKSRQAPVVAADTSTPGTTTNFSSFKPPSGTPAATPQPTTATPKTTETTASTAAPPPAQPAPIVRTAPVVTPPPAKPVEAPAPHSATPASETGLTFVVQVAAVSHQEDADLLVAALKRKNYSVTARSEPQDKLVHIQIGPFASKKDAEAMRQRLLGDGYNAMVK